MDFEKIKQSLDRISLPQYVKFIAENNGKTCDKCRQYHGKVFEKNDSKRPVLPIHPNCRCEYQDIPISQQSAVLQEERQSIASMLTVKHHLSHEQADDLAKQIICAKLENKKLNSEKLFLLFNGRFLLSSDGELLLDAVSGAATNKKIHPENFILGQQQVETRTFDYSYKRQGIEKLGSIPAGLYYIRSSEERSLEKIKMTHVLNVRGWGVCAWELHAAEGTDMRKRKGFFIHGGTVWGSAGCIDLRYNDTFFRLYLRKGNIDRLYVAVSYDKEFVEITEKQEVKNPAFYLENFSYPNF